MPPTHTAYTVLPGAIMVTFAATLLFHVLLYWSGLMVAGTEESSVHPMNVYPCLLTMPESQQSESFAAVAKLIGVPAG